jgi:hypothetical protein
MANHVKHEILRFNCRYNPRMDYAFYLLTLKSSEKWRSSLFGATCNFNDQILPYGILFLTFINTNVFHLLPFKFSRNKFLNNRILSRENNEMGYWLVIWWISQISCKYWNLKESWKMIIWELMAWQYDHFSLKENAMVLTS